MASWLKSIFASLRLRLTVLIVFASLPAFILLFYLGNERRQAAINYAEEKAAGIAQNAAQQQNQVIESSREFLDCIAHLPVVENADRAECKKLFADLLKEHPNYSNIGLADPTGDVIASGVELQGEVNLTDRGYFTTALETNGFAMGDYQVGRITGKPGINYALAVPHDGRPIKGVVFVAVDLAWLNKMVADQPLPQGASLTIISQKGVILATSPNAEEMMGQRVDAVDDFRVLISQLHEPVKRTITADGDRYLYSLAPLMDEQGSRQAYANVRVPITVVLEEAQRLQVIFLVVLTVAVATAITIAWIGSNLAVMRPVRSLVKAATAVRKGDLSTRTGLARGIGELGILGEAFDEMAVALEEMINQLYQATEKYRALAEQALVGVYLISDGQFAYCNQAMAGIFGYDRTEVIKKLTPDDIVHQDDRALVREKLVKHIDGELVTAHYTVRGIRKDGTMLFCEFYDRRIDIGGKPAVIGTIVDTTERNKVEAKLKRHLEDLTALYTGAQKLSESIDIDSLADDIVKTCVRILGVKLALLRRAEADGSMSLMAHFPAEATFPQAVEVRWDDSVLGRGPSGRALRLGMPVVVTDLEDDLNFAPWRAVVEADGINAIASLPLISRGRPFGVLSLCSDEPGFFTIERINLLQAYAHQAAAALENARLFADMERHLNHLRSLRAIDMVISNNTDLDATLGVILDQAVRDLRVDAVNILLLDPQTQTLKHVASCGFRDKEYRCPSLMLGESHAGRAALEQRTIYIQDINRETTHPVCKQLSAEEGFVSCYAVPLMAKGKVGGVLEILHRSPLQVDQEWLEFLELLAGQAAIAIESARLVEKLQEANLELSTAYDTTLEGWAWALDLRDRDTENHSRRVTEMTVRVAQAIGLDEADLVHVRRGALLHDIGKLGIPDSILHKPGPLTDDEARVMQQHPVYAYEMLSRIDYLRPAVAIPYCHHERWDGTGYPRELKGTDIPLAARIFALSDAYDAMTNERPYRQAMSHEAALLQLLRNAGTQFDPNLVELFISIIEGNLPIQVRTW